MKNIFLLILSTVAISCLAQTYPLRTYGIEFPKDSYQKDINNELLPYEGTWKGIWDNKTIYITFKRIKYYKSVLGYRAYYADILIGKFKVIDANGNVLFNNTNLADDNAKINGSNFIKDEDKYSLYYIDSDLCNTSGRIQINFTDSTKTKLDWKYFYRNEIITSDCPYYNTSIPQPLPKEIILTKQ
ncbi:DUF6705 family protein [uncultured Chryseobacterium sp.]|uniref:DUF6705 family protein n=2 Tax=uncultured Chryseobacterium sp. TaxID=259322 RepID=UPI0025DEFE39|nr:DUF6705 family protein [uncultured Chryseobacterium sp.]